MNKAGGILGIIAGIFGFIAAIITLLLGGLGSAFKADGAQAVVGLGWGGVLFSFLAIVFGAIAFARPKGAGIGLIVVSVMGAVLGGTFVAICMALSLIGGLLALVGAKKTLPTQLETAVLSESSPRKKGQLGWILALAGVASIVLFAVIGIQNPTKLKENPSPTLATQTSILPQQTAVISPAQANEQAPAVANSTPAATPASEATPAPTVPTAAGQPAKLASEPSVADILGKYRVSFDCSKASTGTEKLTCATPILSQLDGLMVDTYKSRLSDPVFGVNKALFKASQVKWIKSRNACDDTACLEKSYRQRISDLCDVPVLGVHPRGDCDVIDE